MSRSVSPLYSSVSKTSGNTSKLSDIVVLPSGAKIDSTAPKYNAAGAPVAAYLLALLEDNIACPAFDLPYASADLPHALLAGFKSLVPVFAAIAALLARLAQPKNGMKEATTSTPTAAVLPYPVRGLSGSNAKL